MTTNPQMIHLKDYKPSDFQIKSIDLIVDIREKDTLVTSTINFTRTNKSAAILELDGEMMKLESIKINNQALSSDDYNVTTDKLIIKNLTSDSFTLETQVLIDPFNNTSCEGFYKSGDQLCTQCEAQGFRKITYYLDRPDVMSKFTTKMIADKKRFPYLLANGNRVEKGDLPNGKHFTVWEDPFKKPAYLFAMVAGDFDVAVDTFTTMKNRKVDLEIYVDKGNLHKTEHAMTSLKKSMKWDEDTYGLEYDLDIYMIVAVDSFNMGAMENKGLNIFNSTYTLADKTSATDDDFQRIESVIGHEYFHNWTGNRVTCRDWFQLTLKEGLTVYRDQEFSSDMLSRAVKRIEDVRHLKEAQFPEDAGPTRHPIRPSSYIEINNFYTMTIYEKGSEVIRMIATLVGRDTFRKGMDKYFELFDGQAVTTEDFVHAMELASGKDLSQFKNWYSRSGTPTLKIQSSFSGSDVEIKIEQIYPEDKNVSAENILHMPFSLGIISKSGEVEVHNLELRNLVESFKFKASEGSVLSLNRNFSAPVIIDHKFELKDLIHLMSFDTDSYCRFEATQTIYKELLKLNALELDESFVKGFERILKDESLDLTFKSYLLDMPSHATLANHLKVYDFDVIGDLVKNFRAKIANKFLNWFEETYQKLSQDKEFLLTPEAYGKRALKNQCLRYMVATKSEKSFALLKSHFDNATNMTEEIFALKEFIASGVDLDHEVVQKFYQKWKHDGLVMIKWFEAIAAYSPKEVVFERIDRLEKDPLYQNKVPNYIRALYMQFGKMNLRAFHQADGSGYRFLAEKIKMMDGFNPQVASRHISCFSLYSKIDNTRKEHMKKSLETIMGASPSKDTFEIVSSYLN